MSMGFDNKSPIEPETARSRNWPCLRQFGVFMENRVGLLYDMLRQVERHDLRVLALSIADSVDCAVARLIVDHYERALEFFQLSNLSFFESDLIGVELPEGSQSHMMICQALMEAEVNIHYSYPLLFRRSGRGAIAMYVDDLDQGLKSLREKGLTIITEKDLQEDDQYFLD
ncbi:MAG: acetolactate synthase [Planctomycetaceae bacterium]